MRIFYNLGIYLYYVGIFIFSFFNIKAKKWWDGRKGEFQKYSFLFNTKEKIAWFHAASLGEFEQGRTVIENFKLQHPAYKILLTFFSPSGYEVRKNYSGADFILYLPIDTPFQAKKFIEMVHPDIVFFIKYEFWFNYIKILHDKQVPVYLISGIFRPQQHFFKVYGAWYRNQLKHFTHFFVQGDASMLLLQSIGLTNVTVSGDTRFDRVIEIANAKKSFPLIEKFITNHAVLIAGSSWEADEDILIDYMKSGNPGLRYIIAPHEVDNERINKLQQKLPFASLLFSDVNEENVKGAKILIINNIGILSHLYQYANFAMIGGGFGKGIHNILEAVAFGNPVLFGPNYHKFSEANQLIHLGGAFEFDDIKSFNKLMYRFTDNISFLEKTKKICTTYIESNKGATSIILQHIQLQ